jgi:hypothetical protein
MTEKFPQSGDPDLLPKPLVTEPTSRRMPFGPSGILKPKGPEFDVPRAAPDLKGLPWQRRDNDEWTSEEQRAEVLDFLLIFMRDNHPLFVTWKVIERDRHGMSPRRLRAPLLIFYFTRQADRKEFELGMQYSPANRSTTEAFRARTEQVGPSILALVAQS